jgi:shikimate dehydrogenase
MRALTGNTKCGGIIGWPISHSLSPRLHGYWLDKYKIDGAYIPLLVKPEHIEEALRALPVLGFRGVNLTLPHKETAFKIVDHVDPLAQHIGAINTVIVREDGKLEGRNTDTYGFTQNLLAAGFVPTDRPVMVLGAGGAARAAVAALVSERIHDIRIVNRTSERAETLAGAFPQAKITVHKWNDTAAFKDIQLLVNATSLGMKTKPLLEISLDALPSDAWVNDMVYAPLETDLLKQAAARGNKTVDGLGMLLHQARPAFAAFFGVEPEVTDDLRHYVLKAA